MFIRVSGFYRCSKLNGLEAANTFASSLSRLRLQRPPLADPLLGEKESNIRTKDKLLVFFDIAFVFLPLAVSLS
jgi:hypothetical protein